MDARSSISSHVADLLEVLEFQEKDSPDRTVYTFCRDDGETDEVTIAGLGLRARAIAARLQQVMDRGERALLVFPPGLEFIEAFFGCLHAGVLAVPATYPKPRRPMPRLESIAADCQPTVVLTTAQTKNTVEVSRVAPQLQPLPWLAVDEVSDSIGRQWRRPVLCEDDLAFVQYTSGSTSDPKGVMVSHANLMSNLEMIRVGFGLRSFELDEGDPGRGVFWLPAYHDMGLIGGILEPFYIGSCSVLMSPTSFLQRPLRWLETISKLGASVSGAPNFAYEMCVQKTTPEQRSGLDLSSWKVAFCGAEPVRPETLEQFAEAFAPCGFDDAAFYPCYGMAETTLLAAGPVGPQRPEIISISRRALAKHEVRKPDAVTNRIAGEQSNPEQVGDDAQRFVTCGNGLHQQIEIVDPKTRRVCPPGKVGEIWIRGASVARGYWDRPEENVEVFNASLAGEDESGFLRTGDLGFTDQGRLVVTGRLKDMMIIRGRNHYPQDIENSIAGAHRTLGPHTGAVFSIDVDGREQVVIVQELSRQHRNDDPQPIFRDLRRAVAEDHELALYDIVLIRPSSLPRTTSGKVQRQLCRQQYVDGELKEIASWLKSRRTAEDAPRHWNGDGHHANGHGNGNGNGHAKNGRANGNGHTNGNGHGNGNGNGRAASPPKPDLGMPRASGPSYTPEEMDRLAERIETWLLDWLVARAGVPAAELDRHRALADFGLDSLSAVEMSQELEDWLHLPLTPVLAWNYPTAASLARYLAEQVGGKDEPDESADVAESADFEQLLAEIEAMEE